MHLPITISAANKGQTIPELSLYLRMKASGRRPNSSGIKVTFFKQKEIC